MNGTNIPEVRRPAEGRLRVTIPWREGGNRKLIRSVCGPRARPEWDARARRWLIARIPFLPLIEALQSEFGQVKAITWHCDVERCGERCQRAHGDECTCSCGGVNHGILGVLSGHRRGWRLAGTAAATEQGWSEWVWIASAGMSASEMAAWIVGEGGRLTGAQLPVPGVQEIFARFIRRFGQRDATRIARAAIEVHRGCGWALPSRPGASPGPMTSSSLAASSPSWTVERKRRGSRDRGRARRWRVVPCGRDERRPALRAQRPDSYLILIAFRPGDCRCTVLTALTSSPRCVALSAPARQPSPMPARIISWLALAVRMPGNAISAVRTSIRPAAWPLCARASSSASVSSPDCSPARSACHLSVLLAGQRPAQPYAARLISAAGPASAARPVLPARSAPARLQPRRCWCRVRRYCRRAWHYWSRPGQVKALLRPCVSGPGGGNALALPRARSCTARRPDTCAAAAGPGVPAPWHDRRRRRLLASLLLSPSRTRLPWGTYIAGPDYA